MQLHFPPPEICEVINLEDDSLDVDMINAEAPALTEELAFGFDGTVAELPSVVMPTSTPRPYRHSCTACPQT